MDFEWNWTNIKSLLRSGKRSRGLSTGGWVVWAAFALIWATALVPFYASGMHHFSALALSLAGGGYAGYGIPYAPLPGDVYGTTFFGGLAQAVVCLGPCAFALAAVGGLLILLTSWRTYSRLGLGLRIAALLVTLILVVLSYDLSTRFMVWGLG